MKTKVYALFDVKAAVYGTPFFMQNDQMALRSFSDLVNEPGTMVQKHPEDFNLFGVGQFDDGLGVLEGMTPWIVATAASCVRIRPNMDIRNLDRIKEFANGGELLSQEAE